MMYALSQNMVSDFSILMHSIDSQSLGVGCDMWSLGDIGWLNGTFVLLLQFGPAPLWPPQVKQRISRCGADAGRAPA